MEFKMKVKEKLLEIFEECATCFPEELRSTCRIYLLEGYDGLSEDDLIQICSSSILEQFANEMKKWNEREDE